MLGKPLQAQEAALQQERQRAQQMQQEFQSKEAEHLRKQREAVRQWNECADRCAFRLASTAAPSCHQKAPQHAIAVCRASLEMEMFACDEELQQRPGCSLPGAHDCTALLWAPWQWWPASGR